jgi:leader peptidase (prepilin peptidase) / N-methyltransferase
MTFEPDLGWLGALYLLAVSWPLARIDVRERRLPNRLTLPAFPIALFGQALAVIFGAELWRLLVSLLLAVASFAACIALNRYAGLGMGDVKLIAGITLSLGWFNPLLPAIAVLIGLLLAGSVSLALVFLRKASMGSSIALGPYLLVGFAFSFIGQGWS